MMIENSQNNAEMFTLHTQISIQLKRAKAQKQGLEKYRQEQEISSKINQLL